MSFLSRFSRSKKADGAAGAAVDTNGSNAVPGETNAAPLYHATPADTTRATSAASSSEKKDPSELEGVGASTEKAASLREDGRIDELEKHDLPEDNLNRLNSRGEDPSMYPSGLKMNLITLSLCMAVFLIALVCGTTSLTNVAGSFSRCFFMDIRHHLLTLPFHCIGPNHHR
jgi:hypothetical protein